MAAARALISMSTECSAAATRDGIEHLRLGPGQGRAIAFPESVACLADHIGHLQGWSRHPSRSSGYCAQRELVEVNEIIHEMVELLRAEGNQYAVSIRTDLVADLPKITADRVQLQQVFMNLILNAIEAMKETGGVLTVKTQLGQHGQMLISVSDTGVGLPKEKTEQIFDAFFTTKPQGSGIGLVATVGALTGVATSEPGPRPS